jgi:hypothetical protein
LLPTSPPQKEGKEKARKEKVRKVAVFKAGEKERGSAIQYPRKRQ